MYKIMMALLQALCNKRDLLPCQVSSEICPGALSFSFVHACVPLVHAVRACPSVRVLGVRTFIAHFFSIQVYIGFPFKSNDDGDPQINALLKMNLYFTSEFRNCLDLFSVPIGVRTC